MDGDFKGSPFMRKMGNQTGEGGHMVKMTVGQEYIPGIEAEPFQPCYNHIRVCVGIDYRTGVFLFMRPRFDKGIEPAVGGQGTHHHRCGKAPERIGCWVRLFCMFVHGGIIRYGFLIY